MQDIIKRFLLMRFLGLVVLLIVVALVFGIAALAR